MRWKIFLIGLLCGIVACSMVLYFVGSRYEVISGALMVVKLDKWTGKTWKVALNEKNNWYWEEIKEQGSGRYVFVE